MSFFTDDDRSTEEDEDFFYWLAHPSTMGLVMLALMKNENFKERFIKRFNEVLTEVYIEEEMEAELDRMIAERLPLIDLQTRRWGYRGATFNSQCELMRKFIKNRRPYVISALCKYFSISEEEFLSYSEK